MNVAPSAHAFSVADLAAKLDGEVVGDGARILHGVAALDRALAGHLSFYDGDADLEALTRSGAGAVLVTKDLEAPASLTLLRVGIPRVAFAEAVGLFHPAKRPAPGIHPTAVVDETAQVGADVHLGAHAVVGAGAIVGEGCVLHPHAVLYADARLGARCTIHSHAVVCEGVRLGDDVTLQPGAVIGADGFGYAPRADGTWATIPQVGTTELGDGVEVGANACIDRAALHVTSVGDGTKIDNLAQIGHNSTIGAHSMICGQVGLAGSTDIADHVVLGGQVGVVGHLAIGKGARVAGGSGVIADLAGGKRYAGVPARPFRDTAAIHIWLERLPSLGKQIKRLQAQVDALEAAGGAS